MDNEMSSILNLLKSIKDSRHKITSCQDKKTDISEIERFEKHYGFKFPNDFKQFCLSEYGTLILEFLDEQRDSSDGFNRGIMVYGFGDKIPKEVDIWSRAEDMIAAGYDEYVPFMVHIGGEEEVYCFDEDGNIALFDYYQSYSDIDIEMSFSELLLREISLMYKGRI